MSYDLSRPVPYHLIQAPSMNKLLLYTLREWCIITILAILMINTPAWLYPLIALLMANRFHALGVILHDLSHQNLKTKSLTMRLIEIFAGYPIASTANVMAYHHNRHHRYSNTVKDPYFRLNQNLNPKRKLSFVLIKGPLLIIGGWLRPLFALMANNPQKISRYAKIFLLSVGVENIAISDEIRRCLKEDRYQLLFQFALIVFISLYPILIYVYVIPVLIAGGLSIFRLINEHTDKLVDKTDHATMITVTLDHHNSLLDRWLFAPLNIGLHIAHHLYPTAAFYHLEKIEDYYKT
jgi:fatty acid desaturase